MKKSTQMIVNYISIFFICHALISIFSFAIIVIFGGLEGKAALNFFEQGWFQNLRLSMSISIIISILFNIIYNWAAMDKIPKIENFFNYFFVFFGVTITLFLLIQFNYLKVNYINVQYVFLFVSMMLPFLVSFYEFTTFKHKVAWIIALSFLALGLLILTAYDFDNDTHFQTAYQIMNDNISLISFGILGLMWIRSKTNNASNTNDDN